MSSFLCLFILPNNTWVLVLSFGLRTTARFVCKIVGSWVHRISEARNFFTSKTVRHHGVLLILLNYYMRHIFPMRIEDLNMPSGPKS